MIVQLMVKRVPNLSDDVLDQSVDGEDHVGMDTKHLSARIFIRGTVYVTWRWNV